jgi:hypothetical protein
VEEVHNKQQSQPAPLRALVWGHLSVTTARALVFDRIGTQKSERILIKTLFFTRLGQSKSKDDNNVLDHQPNLVEGSKDLRSKIPSYMKRQYKWVVSAKATLKGKK